MPFAELFGIVALSGMFRDALPKFKSALTAEQKIGKDVENILVIRRYIVDCHARLLEVSGPHAGLLTKADDFCSLSIRRCCVAATSWSPW